jgi:hypothetical protein
MAVPKPASLAAATSYLLKRGGRPIGPFSIADMRQMVRTGELGRGQSVSDDNGATWVPASHFSEIWESKDLVPLPPFTPEPAQPTGSATPTARATIVLPANDMAVIPTDGQLTVPPPVPAAARRGWGLGLSGFITATAALALVVAPLGIWFTGYEPGYAFVPAVFPLLAAAIVGLALSSVAFGRGVRGFATAGLVVGICGVALALLTAIGWLVCDDPREIWIVRLTSTAEADMQLARKDFAGSLQRYRGGKPDDDPVAVRGRLTKDVLTLAEAHKRLLIAAASTPRFSRYFGKLEQLKAAFTSFTEALKLQDTMTATEAIDEVGRDSTTLRELLDILDLYATGNLSLEAAQAKFRDYARHAPLR